MPRHRSAPLQWAQAERMTLDLGRTVHEAVAMELSDLTIRKVDDVGVLLALYLKCEDFIRLGTDAPIDERMVISDMNLSREEGGTFRGIHVNDNLVGVVDCAPSNYEHQANQAFLILLMIAPEWRSKGLGAAVVRYVERRVWKNREVDVLRTAVQVNNPTAVAFWSKVGFERVGGPTLQPDGTITYLLEKRRARCT